MCAVLLDVAWLTLLLKSDRFKCFVWASSSEGTRSIRQVLPEPSRKVFDVDNDIHSCAEKSNLFSHSEGKVIYVLLWGTEAVPFGRVASRQASCRISVWWWVTQEQGQPFIEPLWPLNWKEDILRHSSMGLLSASALPHLGYRSQASQQFVSSLCLPLPLHEVQFSPKQGPCSSGPLRIPGQASQEPPLQWMKGGQGNISLTFPHHRDTQYEEREQELWSCES